MIKVACTLDFVNLHSLLVCIVPVLDTLLAWFNDWMRLFFYWLMTNLSDSPRCTTDIWSMTHRQGNAPRDESSRSWTSPELRRTHDAPNLGQTYPMSHPSGCLKWTCELCNFLIDPAEPVPQNWQEKENSEHVKGKNQIQTEWMYIIDWADMNTGAVR